MASDQLIEAQRAQPQATAADLEHYAKRFYLEKLQDYERQYAHSSSGTQAEGGSSLTFSDDLKIQISIFEGLLKNLPQESRTAFAYALLRGEDVSLPNDLQWLSSRLYFRANLEAAKVGLARQAGDYSVVPNDRLFEEALPRHVYAPPHSAAVDAGPDLRFSPNKNSKVGLLTVSEFFAAYVARKSTATDDRWTEQTRLQNETTFRLFAQFTKDYPVRDVDESTIVAFKDKLSALPRNWGQNPKYREKTIDQVIAIADTDDPLRRKRLVSKTINRHISAIGGAFSDAKMRAEWRGANPCANLLERKGRRIVKSTDERRPYLASELQRLFSAPIWTGSLSQSSPNRPGTMILKDHRYFIPIIALYTGMRQDEICKLCTEDIRLVGQHWAIEVADTEFGRVKEESSVRLVPMHPAIETAGFIPYVLERKKLGRVHLWPKLRRGGPDKTFGHIYQKQFAETRKAAGIRDRGLTFHSLRHNVSIAMKDAGIDLAIREAIMGHKSHSMTEAVYGSARIHWMERRFESHRAAVLAIEYQGFNPSFLAQG